MNNTIVGKIYQVKKKLGAGAFGEIFLALNIKNNQEYAIKCEPSKAKTPQLFYQSKLINFLNGDDSSVDKGIPRSYYCSTQGEYNVMVMDLLGPSLEDLFNQCNRKFDLKTCLLLAIQMLDRVQFMHTKSFLHRDIKPDNFLIGMGKNCSKVYLIDFGLAKKYTTKDGAHIPYKDNKNLTGTARYASLNTHLGIQQGRRDDIEGLANVYIYLMKGSLPWQNLKAANKKQRYEKIMEKKLTIPLAKLCEGLPHEMEQFMNYCRTIQFQDKPDYQYLKRLLKKILKRQNFQEDNNFSWNEALSKMKTPV